jgi:hypothetical protein
MATILSQSECDPTGSPHSLSPIDDAALKAPDGKESLFLGPPSVTPLPGVSPRGKYLREWMLRKHQPYTLRPAPLELRFAARITGRVHQPEFTPEEIEEVFSL